MRVAVTGASGFVGRHVVAELDRRGVTATLVCRPGSGLRVVPATHRVITMDLSAPIPNPHEALGKPDVLIHLAWDGLPNYRSLRHFEDELPSQYRFLKAAVADGLPSLLVTGTCLEYGMQSGALHEELDTRPTTAYGYAKEALCRQLEFLRQEASFKLTWARLFYLYGVGQASTSLFSQLQAANTRGDAKFDMSSGDQTRDYLAAPIAARALVSLALAAQNIGRVNVCSGRPQRVRDIVDRWIAENGWSITVNRGALPYPDYEPMEFWGDRRKMDKYLDVDVRS